MFLLTRNFLLLPIAFLAWLGQPLKVTFDSSLRNQSVYRIKSDYREKAIEHYFPRIAMTAVGFFLVFLFILGVIATHGGLLLVIPLILMITFSVDGLMILARSVYMTETKKELEEDAPDGKAIVPEGYFKDSSLKAVLKKRRLEVAEFKKTYKERTGREPTESDMKYS